MAPVWNYLEHEWLLHVLLCDCDSPAHSSLEGCVSRTSADMLAGWVVVSKTTTTSRFNGGTYLGVAKPTQAVRRNSKGLQSHIRACLNREQCSVDAELHVGEVNEASDNDEEEPTGAIDLAETAKRTSKTRVIHDVATATTTPTP